MLDGTEQTLDYTMTRREVRGILKRARKMTLVARLAGVKLPTVSLVLKGTRKSARIMEIARNVAEEVRDGK